MHDAALNMRETAVQFACRGDILSGIVSVADNSATRGVLIVVGGPQYRVGSHRQFVLLARDLANAGIPVMRFDYRGMGDSEGAPRAFDTIDDDLRAAVDCFFRIRPMLESVVIWGLCDGACAALFYAPSDARVSGLVLLNPWVRTEVGQARAQLKHYYRARLLDAGFWRKIVRGRFDYAAAIRSLSDAVATVAKPGKSVFATSAGGAPRVDGTSGPTNLPDRMRESFGRFSGRVLIITSGRDMTAKEFLDTVARSRDWQKMLSSPRVRLHDLASADHTFSRGEWRDQVAGWTYAWVTSW